MAHETTVDASLAFMTLEFQLNKVRDAIKLAGFQAEDIEASLEDCSRDPNGTTAWSVVTNLRKAIAPLLAEADALIVRAHDVAATYSSLVADFSRNDGVKELEVFSTRKVCLRDELDEEERA